MTAESRYVQARAQAGGNGNAARKPRLLLRLRGLFLLRFAVRRFTAVFLNEPPRTTRDTAGTVSLLVGRDPKGAASHQTPRPPGSVPRIGRDPSAEWPAHRCGHRRPLPRPSGRGLRSSVTARLRTSDLSDQEGGRARESSLSAELERNQTTAPAATATAHSGENALPWATHRGESEPRFRRIEGHGGCSRAGVGAERP
jgi:hypothetical protein